MVDGEVKRLLDDAYSTALRLLNDNRELLDRIAEALLERETIDREDLDLLVRDLPLPPRSVPPASAAPAIDSGKTQSGGSGLRSPVLGAPPAEPAGA